MSEEKWRTPLRSSTFLAAGLSATLALSGCHFGAPKSPTGQVVATVGDREITHRELEVEIQGSRAITPAAQKAERQAALQRIIQRVALANAARDRGVDKDPSFALLRQRADDTILVQLLETKMAANVPPPTNEEVQQYQETNPNIFSERKIFDVDQIRLQPPSDPQFIKKLEPLKTLDEVATFLTDNHILFQRGTNVMDAVGQNPKLLGAIMALPPHEVFILSSGNEVFVNEIRDARTSPFVGAPATQFALNSLKSQHVQEAVAREMSGILAKARSSVRISKEFEPPPKNPPAKTRSSPTGG